MEGKPQKATVKLKRKSLIETSHVTDNFDFCKSDDEKPKKVKRKAQSQIPSQPPRKVFTPRSNTGNDGEKCSRAYWWNDRTQHLSRTLPTDHPGAMHVTSKLAWVQKDVHFQPPANIPIIKNPKPPPVHITKRISSRKTQDEKEHLRTRKIRIRPTEEQKLIFQSWFKAGRYFYNKSVDLVVNEGFKENGDALRNHLRNAMDCTEEDLDRRPWIVDTTYPSDIKAESCKMAAEAMQTTRLSLESKNLPIEFDMKYKRATDDTQSVRWAQNGSPKHSVKILGDGFAFHTTKIKDTVRVKRKREMKRLRESLAIPEGEIGLFKANVILKYERPGRYYLCLPLPMQTKERTMSKTIALDPGVRTFQTGYDDRGTFKEYGKGDASGLISYGLKIDKLQSELSMLGGPDNKAQRKNKKKLFLKMHNRIKNKVAEAHWKITTDLCTYNEDVMIPRFEVSQMVKKGKRNIGKDTVRKMLTWSHYKFREKLKSKAEEFRTRVHEVKEHYTSMSCGRCGHLHRGLGASKSFKCPQCDFSIDRDFNGARNIYIMNVEEFVGSLQIPSG